MTSSPAASGTLDLRKFKALTFDCYGTLIDWETGIVNALRAVLAAHGRQSDDGELLAAYAEIEPAVQAEGYRLYREVLAEVMRRMAARYGLTFTVAQTASLAESIKDWQPYPDTVAALRRLKTRYRLAIISNIDDDLFAHSAKRLEVPFDFVITAQQVGSYKPALKNFEVALERIGLGKEEVLHVAESVFHDVVPARQLGLHTVWVNRRVMTGRKATKMVMSEPDLVVPDLKTLAELAV